MLIGNLRTIKRTKAHNKRIGEGLRAYHRKEVEMRRTATKRTTKAATKKTAMKTSARRNSAEHNRKISLGMKRHYRRLKKGGRS